MTTVFKTAVTTVLSQPLVAGKFYARSTNAADVAAGSLVGLVASVATAETLTLTGQREVLSTNTFSSLISFTFAGPNAGTVSLYNAGIAAVGTVIISAQPANLDTVRITLGSFTQTYRFVTVLASANDVLIGADETATAVNLRRAIRDGDAVRGDGTGEGTLYGTGTTANPYLDVTDISGQILTLTDLVPCLRQLTWALTQTVGATLSLRSPIGGMDGTLLATITIGETGVYPAILLDDETLTLLALPPSTNWFSDWIVVEGQGATLYLSCSNVVTAITAKYQVSTDPSLAVYHDGGTSITSLDNNYQVVIPPERIRYIRLVLNNTNTASASVNAKLVSL